MEFGCKHWKWIEHLYMVIFISVIGSYAGCGDDVKVGTIWSENGRKGRRLYREWFSAQPPISCTFFRSQTMFAPLLFFFFPINFRG
jgi:hypothetical protein